MSDERPGILTAIAIIGIILGSLGVLAALLGAAGLMVQGQITTELSAAGAGGPELDYARQIAEVSLAYRVPTLVGALANLVVSALLIVGGAMLLARKPVAVGLMTGTIVAAIVVDLYSAALGAYVQTKIAPIQQEMTRALAAEMPAGADPAIMDSMVTAATWAGLAMAVLWLLCKLAYYIVSLVALKRPAVKGWVTEGAAA